MPPRHLLTTLVLAAAALAVGGYWLLGDGDPPAPDAVLPPTPAAAVASPADPERLPPRTSPAGPAPQPAHTPVPAPAPASPLPVPPVPEAPNVLLRVRALATRADVPAFRWRFVNSLATARGEGRDGRAELRLPESAVGELLLEADGLASLRRDGVVVPTSPAGPLQLDLFLPPAVPAAGITLHVRTLASEPVQHLRVDAFALGAAAAGSAWHLDPPLWSRRASAGDGRYVLPPLPAGTYGLRVVGTDEAGEALPLLPFRGTFHLTGDNGFVEDVPLEPGALLELELVDATEAPFDPVVHGATTLELRLPGGPPVPRKWVAHAAGVQAAAIDALPGPGRVTLADAVPGGHYQIAVAVRGTVRVQQQVFLRAGQRTLQRLVVP
jgi:hypothetical protein